MDVYNLHTMKREESVSSPLSVALGNFDGVHSAHAELIKRTVEYAKESGTAAAVWTFSDGAGTLPNKPGVPSITTTEEKLSIMASLGVDYAILESFDDVRQLSPESFVKDLLVEKYGAVCAVCGYNFRFGHRGAGDAKALCELMSPRRCITVPPIYMDGIPVSSSAVRALVADGEMEKAEKLLSRPFSVNLPVLHGKKLGRTIGIPTVNQEFPEGHLIPKAGIYVCTVSFDGAKYPGVTNIGIRPSIENDSHRLNCETHIIGFDGDLYGKKIRISFHKRLRDEMRFDSIDSLKNRISSDIDEAILYLKQKNIFPE